MIEIRNSIQGIKNDGEKKKLKVGGDGLDLDERERENAEYMQV
jgi:hypothetical protein